MNVALAFFILWLKWPGITSKKDLTDRSVYNSDIPDVRDYTH